LPQQPWARSWSQPTGASLVQGDPRFGSPAGPLMVAWVGRTVSWP